MLAVSLGADMEAIGSPVGVDGMSAAAVFGAANASPDPAAVLAQVRAAISELQVDSLEQLGTVYFQVAENNAPISVGAGVHLLKPGYGSGFAPPPAPIGWTAANTLLGGFLVSDPVVPGTFDSRLVRYQSTQTIDTAVILAKEVVFDGDVLVLSDNITQFIIVAETIRSTSGSTIKWIGAGSTADLQGDPIPPQAPPGVPTYDPHDGTGGTFARRNGGDGFEGAAQTIASEVDTRSFDSTNPTPTAFNGTVSLANANDLYNGKRIEFTSGTLAGQGSTIIDYVGGRTKRITVSPAFSEAPHGTDEFRIILDRPGIRGNTGRSAPDVVFYVKHFTQEQNTTGSGHAFQASLPDVDLRGERGGRGQKGQLGGIGGDGAKGAKANSGTFDCQTGPGYGGNGGDGGDGGQGGPGGIGGAGGDILIQYVEFPANTNLNAASMLFTGGAAGVGGSGGAGGAGGEGGDAGNPDSPFCSARPERAGDDGQDGVAGPTGQAGVAGGIGSKSFQQISLATWEEAFTKPYLVRAEDARVGETVVFETINISGAAFLEVVDDRDSNVLVFELPRVADDRYAWTIPNFMDAGTYTVRMRRVQDGTYTNTNTYRVEVLPFVDEIRFLDAFDARPGGTGFVVGLGLRGDVEVVYDGIRLVPVEFKNGVSLANEGLGDNSEIRDVLRFTIPLVATDGDYFSRDNGQTAHMVYLDQPFPLANSDPVSMSLKRTDGMKFLPSVNGFDFENKDMFLRVQDYVSRDGFLGGLFGSDGFGGRAYELFREAYGSGEVDGLGGLASPLVWANFGLWYSYFVNPFHPNAKGFGTGSCFGLSTLSLHDFFGGVPTQDGKTVGDMARGIAVHHEKQVSDEILQLQIAETLLDAVSQAVGSPSMTEIAARYIAGFLNKASDGEGQRHAPVILFIPNASSYGNVLLETVNLIGETINLWDGISPRESYDDLIGAFNTIDGAFRRSHAVTPYRVVYNDPADSLPSRIYFYDNNIPGVPGNDIFLDIYRDGGRVKFKYEGSYGTDADPATETPGGFMLGIIPVGMPLGNVDLLFDQDLASWGVGLAATEAIYGLVERMLDAAKFLGPIRGVPSGSVAVAAAGTVRFVGTDGGFYGIAADNGQRYEPDFLPEALRVDGMRVQFAGDTLPEQQAQSHQWGMPLALNSIAAINEPPAPPTLTGPAASTAGTTPEITWTAVTAAARYELLVIDTFSDQTVIQALSLEGTSYTPLTPLEAGRYRALVRGVNNLSEPGDWSAPREFEIALSTPTPGDFDHDGTVDDRDIDVLFEEIAAGQHRAIYDLTGDMLVDAADATYLVETILATHFGDANLDRLVNAADAAALAGNFGWNGGPAWRRGNFNSDAVVDLYDVSILQSRLGLGVGSPSPAPAAPAALLVTPLAILDPIGPRPIVTALLRMNRKNARDASFERSPAAGPFSDQSVHNATLARGLFAGHRHRRIAIQPSRQLTRHSVDSVFAEGRFD